jgi:hypothetical protein
MRVFDFRFSFFLWRLWLTLSILAAGCSGGAQGPAGPQGPQGETGLEPLRGDAGPIGPAGSSGPAGLMGEAGPGGTVGEAGLPGSAGETGPAGPAGQRGDIGPVGPSGGAPQDWFVDSLAGSDSNDGRSVVTAFSTLSKLQSSIIATGSVIHLARGSLWREELALLPPGSEVRAYGVGPRPIIDGADVAPNASFQKTAGLTNVYQISWTHTFSEDGGKTAHRAWENGTRLQRTLDLASCDSTPGSFYAGIPTAGGPDIIYVHASDHSDVSANAKIYELTRRRWAIQLYAYRNHAFVYSVHTRRNAHADGSLAVDGLISDCLAEDGRIHNIFIRGTAEDTTAWKIEPPSIYGGATMFVTFEDKIDLPGVTYRRCKAIAEPDALGPTGGTNPNVTVGFFGHTTAGKIVGTAVYEECEASGVTQGFGFQNVNNALYYKCSSNGTGIAVGSAPIQTLAVLGGIYRAQGSNASVVRFSADYGLPKKILMRGVRSVQEGTYTVPIWINRSDGYTEITRCSFFQLTGGTFNFQQGSFVIKNNIFYGHDFVINKGPTVSSYVADQNVYSETTLVPAAFFIGTTFYSGLPAWRTASGQDLNSVDADPLFTGSPRMGEFGVAANSPAWTLSAGADYEGEDFDYTLQAYRYSVASGQP